MFGTGIVKWIKRFENRGATKPARATRSRASHDGGCRTGEGEFVCVCVGY